MKFFLCILLSILLFCSFAGSTGSATDPHDVFPLPFQLTDATGGSISFTAYPQRIISLAPSITECLFSLHLDEKIVGVTTYCDYPKEAAKKEKVGSLLTLDAERIFSLKPDLILSTEEGNRPEEIQRLRRLGLRVFVLSPVKELKHVYRDLNILGRLTDSREEAEGVINMIQLKVRETEQALKSITKRPLCFWQLGVNPLVTAGQATLAHHLLKMAGGGKHGLRKRRVYSLQPGRGGEQGSRCYFDDRYGRGSGCLSLFVECVSAVESLQ